MSRVFSVYFDGVHDDVLSHGRVESDLADCAVDFPVTEAVASESDGRARLDATDIGFVHCDPNLHLRQVLGDEKEARSVKAGDHGLSNVHTAVDDHSFDRGLDGAEI